MYSRLHRVHRRFGCGDLELARIGTSEGYWAVWPEEEEFFSEGGVLVPAQRLRETVELN